MTSNLLQTYYGVVTVANYYNPTFLGLFSLGGFTTYMQPYDEYSIIAIGKDAQNNQIGGFKIALYDVTNPTNPNLLASQSLQESDSTSLSLIEHKAILFNKERNYIVVPINIPQYFVTGAIVFTITKSAITPRASI